MTFSNTEINVQDLPKAESVFYQTLDKRFQSLLIIESILGMILITIGTVALYQFNPIFRQMELSLLLVFLWTVINIWLIWGGIYSWKHKGYAMREKDILYKSGIWFRKNFVIAFHRVQHIEIHQGPLERLFGITSMTFFTAGGGSDLTIPGMNPDVAAKIKDWVLKSSGFDEEE